MHLREIHTKFHFRRIIFFQLFQHFLDSAAYRERFAMPPVICISVSTSKTYRRTENSHPILGVEYRQDEFSMTDEYFGRMGLQVRYFLPSGGKAPLAFYFRGDLLSDYYSGRMRTAPLSAEAAKAA